MVSPPLLLGAAAWLASRLKPAPVFFHVQDLQPDAAVSLGMLKQAFLIRCLLALEKFAYQKATKIGSISKEMCQIIQNKIDLPEKVVLLPNWVSLPKAADLPSKGTWKKQKQIALNIPLVSYAGNLGLKQGLEIIIEVARILQKKSEALFVIAGNGGEEAKLKEMANKYDLQNLLFQNILKEEEHTALLLDSDICLIPQKAGTSTNFLPSKLLKILALERPIITNPDPKSALYNAVMEGKFGLLVEPRDPDAMATGIMKLLSDSPLREELGQLGRKYVAEFDKLSVLSNLEDELMRLL